MQEVNEKNDKNNKNEKKVTLYKIGGYTICVVSMGGTAIAIFFPSAVTLIIWGWNADLTICISVINMLTKLALGLFLCIQPVNIFVAWVTRKDRETSPYRDMVEAGIVMATGVPYAVYFSLLTKLSIDTFQQQVMNQTGLNTTHLSSVFFDVANATQIPGVEGTLVGCSGTFNWIGYYFMVMGSYGILVQLKAEYEKIIFASYKFSEEMHKKLRHYRIEFWGGVSLFVVVGGWGNVPYIPLGAVLYALYFHASYAAGYVMGSIHYVQMLLLAFLTVLPFGRELTRALRIILTDDIYPSNEKFFLAKVIIKSILATGLVSCGALYNVFNAVYLMLNIPTAVATGVLGALQEIAVVYFILGFLINLIPCCRNPKTLEQAWENSRIVLPDTLDSQWQRSRQYVPELLGAQWEKSAHVLRSEEKEKTVGWGEWFCSFFSGCNGRRGKIPCEIVDLEPIASP